VNQGTSYKNNSIALFLRPIQRVILLLFAIIIPWQFFFNVYGHIDLPLSVFIICAGFITTMFMRANLTLTFHKLKWPVLGYSLMLATISISSVFRSSDNLYEAANVLGRLGVGLIVILWVGMILNSNNKGLPIRKESIAQAFLVSLFPLGVIGSVLFFMPDLEEAWLKLVSGVLIESDSALTRNNILSNYKIGVVFMNTNAGAICWGMSMWLALWMRQRSDGIWRVAYAVFAIVFCIDVLAAGSRAAMLALVFTVIISIIIQTLYAQSKSWFNRESLINVIIIIITVFFVFLLEHLDFSQGGVSNALDRILSEQVGDHPKRSLLWSHAFTTIRQAPILGYGVIDFETLNFPKGFPPHNSILQVWIYGGLMAVIGLICLFATVFYKLFRKLRQDNDMWLPIVLLTWVTIQSMLTNLPMGNLRIAMLLWLMVSIFLWSPKYDVIRDRR
jgi:O-antigen ligase